MSGPAAGPGGTWVVVPAFNEEARIGAVLEELCRRPDRVVVVDDGSTDGTYAEAAKHPVWLIRHPVNLGQGAALATGIRFALVSGAEVVATFDSDGQHVAADLDELVARLQPGRVDFCLGSRFLGRTVGIPGQRRLLLQAGRLVTWVLSGVFPSDVHNGIRAMTRQGALRLGLQQRGMEHASEILDDIVESGLGYEEVPVTVRYTAETLEKGQKSSSSIRLGLKMLLDRLLP